MPEMDGLTAMRHIRNDEKVSGRHVPIVALTAHALKEDQEECLQAGANGYIAKPVSLEGLRNVIATVFQSLNTRAME